uniref:Uncharacterized protein n=1 Tax=Physcomitrium patens TaxID=3218 RepID=A0A2K1L1T2_PHYPA|nr:hypothetical protein PHYPA_002774 [Physcomitrium patens]
MNQCIRTAGCGESVPRPGFYRDCYRLSIHPGIYLPCPSFCPILPRKCGQGQYCPENCTRCPLLTWLTVDRNPGCCLLELGLL